MTIDLPLTVDRVERVLASSLQPLRVADEPPPSAGRGFVQMTVNGSVEWHDELVRQLELATGMHLCAVQTVIVLGVAKGSKI